MAVKVRNTSSRLNFARLINLDDVECWELPEYPVIEPANDDLRYSVDKNDRIDRLSQAFYGTPDLWWVLALANGFDLVPSDLNKNTVIRVPSPRRVFTVILRKADRGKTFRV
jgi:hypothetical protein